MLEVIDYKLPRLGGGYTVDHVSFTLHRGEVLGIYGLMGAGRTELVESLMGLHPEASGEMVLDGKRITHPVVSEQIARGMVLVPEDRQKDWSGTVHVHLQQHAPDQFKSASPRTA